MTSLADPVNEQLAASAFSRQSAVFDTLYGSNTIVQYKRERVRHHVQQFLPPAGKILELNAGTGEDAIYFAQQGHRVHATDISIGMQEVLTTKVKKQGLGELVTNELCSFTALDTLIRKGPYDLIFSNFAGLNCTHELDKVLGSFGALVKPGGFVTLVILPRFCLWEFLLLFKGKFKTAFRRFFSSNGVVSHVEGEYFKCWYYPPAYVVTHSKKDFDLVQVEGLCTLVPPSYMEHFAEKHAGLYGWLTRQENRFKKSWPWKFIGDYYIITLKKR